MTLETRFNWVYITWLGVYKTGKEINTTNLNQNQRQSKQKQYYPDLFFKLIFFCLFIYVGKTMI